MIRLRGLTWDHPRGFAPLAAAARRWSDLHPDIEIAWDRRSLWDFGEGSLEDVARRYDLLVIDHPVVGTAVELGLFEAFDAEELAPRTAAVGPSSASYRYAGSQWALPIDASAQAAAWRPDLLEAIGADPPSTWDEVVHLAATSGKVAIPMKAMDALCSFFTLSAGASASGPAAQILSDREADLIALRRLASLCEHIDGACFDRTPIQTLDAASAGDSIAFIPLTFAYSNYSRSGFAPDLIAFGDIPCGGAGGAILGGAGIAVSASSEQQPVAQRFARWLADVDQQRTIVVENEGQPACRDAWEDAHANELTHGFFRSLLPTLDRASVRPNAPGFAAFQTEAGKLLQGSLRRRESPEPTLERLTELYDPVRKASS